MRGKLVVGLMVAVVLSVLFSRGKNRSGKYRTRKARQLRRAFLVAAAICAVIDLLAIASGGVSNAGDVMLLLATTVVPFTYLYWRFGGFRLGSKRS
jgi:archaellum biogenesis protein FlaJ (TadC family)